MSRWPRHGGTEPSFDSLSSPLLHCLKSRRILVILFLIIHEKQSSSAATRNGRGVRGRRARRGKSGGWRGLQAGQSDARAQNWVHSQQIIVTSSGALTVMLAAAGLRHIHRWRAVWCWAASCCCTPASATHSWRARYAHLGTRVSNSSSQRCMDPDWQHVS